MNTNKSTCPWCNRVYSSGGHYANHIAKAHPERVGASQTSLPRRTRHVVQVEERLVDTTINPEQESADTQDELGDYHHSEDYADPEQADIEEEEEREGFPELEQSQDIEGDYESNGEADSQLADDSDSETDSTNEQSDSDIQDLPPQKDSIPPPSQRVEAFPNGHKAGQAIREYQFEKQRSSKYNHLHPFLNSRDYKLARFMIESEVPKNRINQFFK